MDRNWRRVRCPFSRYPQAFSSTRYFDLSLLVDSDGLEVIFLGYVGLKRFVGPFRPKHENFIRQGPCISHQVWRQEQHSGSCSRRMSIFGPPVGGYPQAEQVPLVALDLLTVAVVPACPHWRKHRREQEKRYWLSSPPQLRNPGVVWHPVIVVEEPRLRRSWPRRRARSVLVPDAAAVRSADHAASERGRRVKAAPPLGRSRFPDRRDVGRRDRAVGVPMAPSVSPGMLGW